MSKWKRKPVEVEASIYEKGMEDGFVCPIAEEGYCGYDVKECLGGKCEAKGRIKPIINTPEGPRIINPGDYIVTMLKGERYPCKPVVFLTYHEPVDDE